LFPLLIFLFLPVSLTLTYHPHLVPRSIISRSYTPLPLVVCMALARQLYFSSLSCCHSLPVSPPTVVLLSTLSFCLSHRVTTSLQSSHICCNQSTEFSHLLMPVCRKGSSAYLRCCLEQPISLQKFRNERTPEGEANTRDLSVPLQLRDTSRLGSMFASLQTKELVNNRAVLLNNAESAGGNL
jgi:hypothetical protein